MTTLQNNRTGYEMPEEELWRLRFNVEPKKFVPDIVLPMVQDMLGGQAVGGILAAIGYGVIYTTGYDIDWTVLLPLTQGAVGVAVGALFFAIHALGDNARLITAMYNVGYRAGVKAQKTQTDQVTMQLNDLAIQYRRLKQSLPDRGVPGAKREETVLEQIERGYRNAQELLRLSLGGQQASRRTMAPKMGEVPYTQAHRLLVKAGARDEKSNLLITNTQEAYKALKDAYEESKMQATTMNIKPAWLMG